VFDTPGVRQAFPMIWQFFPFETIVILKVLKGINHGFWPHWQDFQ
jgi:hypothetical protein